MSAVHTVSCVSICQQCNLKYQYVVFYWIIYVEFLAEFLTLVDFYTLLKRDEFGAL